MAEELQNNIDPLTGLPVTAANSAPKDPITGLKITNNTQRKGVLGNVLGEAETGNTRLLDNMSFKDYESYKSYGVKPLPDRDWET